MAEEATPTAEKPEQKDAPKQQEGESKTFTQEDLDKIVQDRIQRERAKYSNYDDLKQKAAKFDEIEEASASELDKAQGKVTKAEERASKAEARLLRYEVAQEKEVPASLVPLLTAVSREELEAQADLIVSNAKPADQGQSEKNDQQDWDGGARERVEESRPPEAAHGDFLMNVLDKTHSQ